MLHLRRFMPVLSSVALTGQSTTALAPTSCFLFPHSPGETVNRRHYPARGTKPPPRYNFDFRDLAEKTGGKYTHLPLKIRRMGGRDPESRRKVNIRIGPGYRFDYFMVDTHRRGPNDPNETYDERVIEIRRDPNRSPHLALVAGTNGKRWIYATKNMEAGQIIKTSGYIPDQPIIGVEGNAYPIGALAESVKINCVELYPDVKEHVCITEAGSFATISRQQGDFTVVKMANQHEYALKKECMATVGELSHADYHSKIWGSPQMHRRFGFRMAGGVKQKKDGYQGWKRPRRPPVRTFDQPAPLPPLKQKWTMTKSQMNAKFGPTQNVPKLVAEFNNIVRL